jgi:hypothetical protein
MGVHRIIGAGRADGALVRWDHMTVDYTLLPIEGEGWRFDFEEPALTLIGVNHQTRLHFGSTEVVIETPFHLDVGERTYPLDPSHRSGLGPLLTIYPDTLTDAVATTKGVLRLSFQSGSTLIVPPNPQGDAWSVVGRAGTLVVCTPGGEVAVWRAPGSPP